MSLKVEKLHEHPELLSKCCDLLNQEWPRSRAARMHSLQKSRPDLPCSLVMTPDASGEPPDVIGHSRLSILYAAPDACWIESVIVCEERRGQGLGKKIMEETETLAKSLGYKVAYLCTRDKLEFYSHIGYKQCEPVTPRFSSFAPNAISNPLLPKNNGFQTTICQRQNAANTTKQSSTVARDKSTQPTSVDNNKVGCDKNKNNTLTSVSAADLLMAEKQWMVKTLS